MAASSRIENSKSKKNKARGITRPKLDEPKVFGIGFHKTGTTTLAQALSILGYRTIHGDPRGAWPGADEGRSLVRMIKLGDFNLPTFSLFDAFTDNPYFSIWREIDRRFDARFVLTMRDEEAWIDSCARFYEGRRVRPMRAWLFGEYADPSSSLTARQAWLEAFRRHNEAVLEHFDGRDDFIVMHISDGDGWDKLCPFLEKRIPWKSFPHKNRTT